MSAVGASGDRLVVIALNDYSAELPLADVRKYKVILALKRDGEYLSVRDKGPLFIVYDFDGDPDLRNQKFYARSVWQIARIEVKRSGRREADKTGRCRASTAHNK